MRLCPVTLAEAKAFVAEHHRHSVPPLGWRFGVGLDDNGVLVGVAMLGRPVARGLDNGLIIEALRVCTIGHKNACTMLYGACRKMAAAAGYDTLVTYTRDDEPGSSLRAAGFRRVATVKGRSWDTPSRRRSDRDERVSRVRWEIALRTKGAPQ